MGLGPKLLSYRAAPGKGGFFKGTLSGPFSAPDGDDDGGGKAERQPAPTTTTKRPSGMWAWGKKAEEEKTKEPEGVPQPEGVEVRRGVRTPRCWIATRRVDTGSMWLALCSLPESQHVVVIV